MIKNQLFNTHNKWLSALGTCLFFYIPICAGGQPLLVFTEALTATRESCAAYSQVVDFSEAPFLTPAIMLPGKRLAVPGKLDSFHRLAWTVTETNAKRKKPTSHDVFSFLSFLPVPTLDLQMPISAPIPLGWEPQAATTIYRNDITYWVCASERTDEQWVSRGRLDIWRYRIRSGVVTREQEPWSVPLPGGPIALDSLSGVDLAILCKNANSNGSILQLWCIEDDTLKRIKEIPIENAHTLNNEPAGMAHDPANNLLFILTWGYPADNPSGSPTTYVHVINLLDNTQHDSVVALPGKPHIPCELVTQPPGNCWLVTYESASSSAHVIQISTSPTGTTINVDVPILGALEPLLVAAEPRGNNLAVANGKRLEIWHNGKPGDTSHDYDSSIRALVWCEEGLFLGEAGRVHRVHVDTAEPIASASFQTGQVAQIIPLDPHDFESAKNVASQTPFDSFPTPGIPPAVVMEGYSTFKLRRRIPLPTLHSPQESWKIDPNISLPPWLRVEVGLESTRPYADLVVNTALMDQENLVAVPLQFLPTGDVSHASPAPNAKTTVYVIRKTPRMPRILWLIGNPVESGRLRDPNDPRALNQLLDLLASPPLYTSHVEPRGQFPEDLSPFSAVVVDLDALQHGALTRTALIDYTLQGGAVLLIGKHKPDWNRGMTSNWLAPFGISWDPLREITGRFSTTDRVGLLRHWQDFYIEKGCAIQRQNDTPVYASVSTTLRNKAEQEYVFVAREVNRGRIAAIASLSPLQNTSMENTANQRFAVDMFRWLLETPRAVNDLDGDGLSDWFEDKNNDGKQGVGETSMEWADTDGDGLPDGKEDRNQNGLLDEGETSPLNVDSDGDGIWDGADASPTLPAGAPIVFSLQPETGPAEGGTSVLISGRNFTPDSTVWFDNTAARTTTYVNSETLLVETPPSPDFAEKVVDIRVQHADTQKSCVLPGAFTYIHRSRVRLKSEMPQYHPNATSGEFSLIIATDPPLTSIGRISFLLEPEQKTGFYLDEVLLYNPGANLIDVMTTRPSPTGGLWVDFAGQNLAPANGKRVTIKWHSDKPLVEMPPVCVAVKHLVIHATNGSPLDASADDIFVQYIQLI
ncbi:MAG TPA: IPT/TIG domain-containing protein [Candidatus Hydrogenedentes bacterium]|nr:IPT/TIG domain-containing protein [Candidatus Hydrogenedentota bacterium]HOL75975.1 IPT/TIG domain-containing protein [Candidatus Hydrogenedentota bacterium]HPO85616.1 IPT/TIG domain-containing protein [Candidatus Hydrogenedentota bacterium]